jgi:hypothetical protein
MGDTAHIDTVFKFLPHTHQHGCNDPCLKPRIISAVKNIDAPMLTRVWLEVEYRIEACRVTRGAYIEHLWLSKTETFSFSVAMNNSIKVEPFLFFL